MHPEDIAACLALMALRGPGSGHINRLLLRLRSPRAALRFGVAEFEALGLSTDTAVLVQTLRGLIPLDAHRSRDWLLANDIAVCSVHDAQYPRLLRELASPPSVLFLRGAAARLGEAAVAIVGSRRPTATGRELAHDIAAGLAGRGLSVVSGLAIGIDTAAHTGALDAGGATVAVLGTGLDSIYPRSNLNLAKRIVAEDGLLVTEFPPGTTPDPRNFPRRNRIVSGLALGVLVVEAALPSGSLLTAQHAAEQDREVMAVPGSVRSPVSRGCHELLRNGAALIESADDVLRALGDRFAPRPARGEVPPVCADSENSEAEQQVLEATGYEEISQDALIQRTGLEAATVASALVLLELRGLVGKSGAGYSRTR